jgi:hypothetical protein
VRSVIQIALRLSTVIGLLAPFAMAHAQAVTGDRARAALERTDERISLAQSLVAGVDNDQADVELHSAVGIQAQARATFDQAMASTGDGQSRLLQQSLDLTQRARARADRAISLIQALPDPDRVVSQVERTREMLDRGRERIEGCHNDRAHAVLHDAMDMQSSAEAAARESRYLAALQLTLGARERGLRALRLCNIGENLQEAAERALRRTDEVIARAREIVTNTDRLRAREVLARAERIQAQASEEFRGSRFEAALRMTQSARAVAHRAVRVAGGMR